MASKPVSKMAAPRRATSVPGGEFATIRFTGASGGTLYAAEGGEVVLRPGDTIRRPCTGHWAALVDSGDAEIVRE
jgi:hypothetical protein